MREKMTAAAAVAAAEVAVAAAGTYPTEPRSQTGDRWHRCCDQREACFHTIALDSILDDALAVIRLPNISRDGALSEMLRRTDGTVKKKTYARRANDPDPDVKLARDVISMVTAHASSNAPRERRRLYL